MSTEILAVSPRTRLVDAVQILWSGDIHTLVVVESGHVIGIVTQTDVLRVLAARGLLEKARSWAPARSAGLRAKRA